MCDDNRNQIIIKYYTFNFFFLCFMKQKDKKQTDIKFLLSIRFVE